MRKEYYRDWQENVGYEDFYHHAQLFVNEKDAENAIGIINSVDNSMIINIAK